MLSTLVLSNEKPPPLCVSIGGGSMSLNGEEKTLFEVATKEDLDAVFAEVFGSAETQA